VLSRSDEAFRDRKDAGKCLGQALKDLHIAADLTLGIPRGGAVVAKEVSNILNVPLDIVLSRKLAAPNNPELAVGAISETGKIFLDAVMASSHGADKEYIKKESERQKSEMERRAAIFRKMLPKLELQAKTVIVTDDGLATGATMQASLWAVRQEGARRLIAAVPVASAEAVERISGYCDEVVVLKLPDFFGAVGQFYVKFDQTADAEVIDILKEEFTARTWRV